MPHTMLTPDVAQTKRHLAALDFSPDAAFGFRAIGEAPDATFDGGVLAFGTLDRGVRQSSNLSKHGQRCRPGNLMSFLQARGGGVFVVPNELDGAGQREANVAGIRASFVDCDTRRSVEVTAGLIARTGLTPTITVASGGQHEGVDKLHHYWLLAGCPVPQFRAAQAMLVSRTGGDPACTDPSRVLRLAGFWHLKGEPRMTRIVAQADVQYSLADFMARLAAEPAVCPAPTASRPARGSGIPSQPSAATARLRFHLDRHGGLIVPAAKAAIADTLQGERHLLLRALVARLVPMRWPDADVLALIEPAALAAWPDVDAAELRTRLERLLAFTQGRETAKVAPAQPASDASRRLARAFGAHA